MCSVAMPTWRNSAVPPRPGHRGAAAGRGGRQASSPWPRCAPRHDEPCGSITPSAVVVVDYLVMGQGRGGPAGELLRPGAGRYARRPAARAGPGLHSPVLALASQNRSAGITALASSAALDSLKESGDLEYAADVVLSDGSERAYSDPAGTSGRADRGEEPPWRYRQSGVDLSADLGTMWEEAHSKEPLG